MNFSGKKILIISPEPWGHIFVSKHHYAVHLAKRGATVIFANPPGRNWSLNKTDDINLQILSYPRFPIGLRFFPSAISQRIIQNKLARIESFCGIRFNIIWSFDNSVFFDFTRVQTFNISHIVDLNQDFNTRKAAGTANICFYNNELVGKRLRKYNLNTHFINHGFNSHSIQQQVDLPGNNKYKGLYAGNLNMLYIDWENLYYAAEMNQNVDFVFLGPLDEQQAEPNPTVRYRSQLHSLHNVYFVGKVAAPILANYYKCAHILLICYRKEHHHDQANPHKMMEYLGSGRPIVCSYTREYSTLKTPQIEMCSENSQFGLYIQKVIDNLGAYTSKSVVKARELIALENTYDKQIDRAGNLIEPSVHG